jgi:hypothetical protein
MSFLVIIIVKPNKFKILENLKVCHSGKCVVFVFDTLFSKQFQLVHECHFSTLKGRDLLTLVHFPRV